MEAMTNNPFSYQIKIKLTCLIGKTFLTAIWRNCISMSDMIDAHIDQFFIGCICGIQISWKSHNMVHIVTSDERV